VQHDIRYVAIELGIGAQQPHPASDVFTKRYGDCKDKATLLSSILKEIGVDSYYV
jgi:transglutaminase-like putative cysteine protease